VFKFIESILYGVICLFIDIVSYIITKAFRGVSEMLIENIELSMSHVGLGALNEYALMVLFGNAHSHSLVQGVGITPDRIKDNQGLLLYPAYFMTHLKIPADSLISSYKYGIELMLESTLHVMEIRY
jgi:hypothetical protein